MMRRLGIGSKATGLVGPLGWPGEGGRVLVGGVLGAGVERVGAWLGCAVRGTLCQRRHGVRRVLWRACVEVLFLWERFACVAARVATLS